MIQSIKKNKYTICQLEKLVDYIGLLQTREILSAWAGHKVARIALTDAKIKNSINILSSIGLHIEVKKSKIFLKKDIGKGGWSNKFLEGENLNPDLGEWLLYVSNNQKKSYNSMKADENEDETSLGEDLGIPNCCIDFYDRNREKAFQKQNDFVPLVLENTKGDGPYNFWNNYVSQYFGYSLLSFFPCSFNCKNAANFAQNTYELLNAYLPFHAKKTIHFQKQNLIYTEYKGIHMYENSKFIKSKKTINLSNTTFHSTLKPNALSLNNYLEAKDIFIINKNSLKITYKDKSSKFFDSPNISNCIFN
jgi:hypothetical protein